MVTRWSILVALGCAASTPTTGDTPRANTETPEATTSHAIVEGYVRDAETDTTVPGIRVEAWLGPRDDGRLAAWAISDERGFFRLDVEPGNGFVHVDPGENADAPSVAFRAGHRIRIDVKVAADEVVKWRAMYPVDACPGSPPGTIVEGHTTSQQDLDDIARTILERSTREPHAIPDLGIRARKGAPIAVLMDVGPRKQLSPRALPPTGFVLKTLAELQVEADRTDQDVSYVELSRLYSNGSCATVDVGGDYVSPSNKLFAKLCCCSGRDIYEKRGGKWTFVRRVSGVCA